MIPPLTQEEFERLVPTWAQELRGQGCPLAISLPVYCVLYGPKYGGEDKARGIVANAAGDWAFVVCREHNPDYAFGFEGPRRKRERCWGTSGAAAYYVPDMDTPEGVEHVRQWKAGTLPPLPPPRKRNPPLATEELDSIGKLAVGLIGDYDKEELIPLERLKELYDLPEGARNADAVDLAIEFVCAALGSRSFDHLQAAWRSLDLPRMTGACILSFCSMSHLVRPRELLPERSAFIESCREEFRRRGRPEDEIKQLFGGLA